MNWYALYKVWKFKEKLQEIKCLQSTFSNHRRREESTSPKSLWPRLSSYFRTCKRVLTILYHKRSLWWTILIYKMNRNAFFSFFLQLHKKHCLSFVFVLLKLTVNIIYKVNISCPVFVTTSRWNKMSSIIWPFIINSYVI